MKNKKSEKNMKQDNNKIWFTILSICTILCFVIGIALYIMGIRRMLPVLLIFVLSFFLAVFILLLSKNALEMKKLREKRMMEQKNV